MHLWNAMAHDSFKLFTDDVLTCECQEIEDKRNIRIEFF